MDKAVKEYPEKPVLYGKTTISLGDLSKSGVYGDASLATEEKGKEMEQIFANKMAEFVLEGYEYFTK